MVYSSEDTLFMLASEKVTGDPSYNGEIIFTFNGGRLSRVNPPPKSPIKVISKLFMGHPLPKAGRYHLPVGMIRGIPHVREAIII